MPEVKLNLRPNLLRLCIKINKNISLLIITQLGISFYLCFLDYYLVLISFFRALDISSKNYLLNSILL
ncbi:hypothetical protein [Orientia tsutsugamushi]|uniref:hypothetical protein n=1 Tax=Orientia tsutsugamushi TaxID=784 RepID=UPI003528D61F